MGFNRVCVWPFLHIYIFLYIYYIYFSSLDLLLLLKLLLLYAVGSFSFFLIWLSLCSFIHVSSTYAPSLPRTFQPHMFFS